MLTIVENMMNENVKEEALVSLPLIINLLKKASYETSVIYTKQFLKALIDAVQEEYDVETLISELRCIKEIIEIHDGKFFTPEELKLFSE